MSENTSVSCVRYCAHLQYWNPDVVQWGWARFCSVWLSLVLATWPRPTGMYAVAQCPECYWRDAQVRLHSVNHPPEGSAGHIETAGERGRECVIISCYKVGHESHKSTINATVKIALKKITIVNHSYGHGWKPWDLFQRHYHIFTKIIQGRC